MFEWYSLIRMQILEAEGMAVPEEVPQILHVVSEYLQNPCPITSSVSPSCPDGQRYSHNNAEGQSDPGQVRCLHTALMQLCNDTFEM